MGTYNTIQMKAYNNKNNYKSTTLFFLFTILFAFGSQAQNTNSQTTDSIQVVDNAISISNISEESEKLSQRIKKLRKILKPSTEIKEVDSLLNSVSVEVNRKKDTLLIRLNKITHRDLKVNKVEWNKYRSDIKSVQKIIKDRTEELTGINDEMAQKIDVWETTKERLESSSKSKGVYSSLDLIIKTLQEILQLTHERLDSIFIVQKGLTELVLNIDETITEMEQVKLQMQKEYFVFDNKPLWKSKNLEISAIDSTAIKSEDTLNLILSGLKKNKEQVKEFISLNVKTAILQMLFILTLLVLIISVNKKWKNDIKELTNPIEVQARIVLSNPISASVVLGVLISAFFYDAFIPAFVELHVILILIGTLFLLPKLTNKSFSLFLFLIFIAYLIQTFETFLSSKIYMLRWIMIIDAIILIVALVLGRKIMKRSPEQFKPVYKLFIALSPIYILILIVSIIVNIIGMVNLSSLLFTGILISTVLGMVVFLSVKIVTSLVVIFSNIRKPYTMETLSTIVTMTNQRIRPILVWTGLFVWIMFTLKGFDVYNFIITWVNELMHVTWEIGEMTISLGGILAFLTISMVTLLIAKLVAAIFSDDWMINILPRGVAPAISLVLRIIIVATGLYIALSAAGIDLSKLGWMLGALGVGIGFGLQNIVLNFISGLILAFERPINLGDTIEIDQEMGIVTNIGIRSSNIKSYSGYEAIIPNGDLISKKVINYTLTNRDRRSKILMKTAPNADPEEVIALFNKMASEDPKTRKNPAPKTYFYGYDEDGNLSFALLYWTTFSDTLKTDSEIALKIFTKLKEEGIQSPAPVRRIVKEK
ncbi:MAG: mechanosensitive ion channel [Flavobacteriaceae bacterium]|nr:mechanosensitive ion channel [Flavobacteriaceae bacterium]